jgi:hypothetical protein
LHLYSEIKNYKNSNNEQPVMKRILKILKRTGLVLVSVVLTVSVLTASRQSLKYDASYPEIRASRDTAVIARGKHLVNAIAHCMNCHSRTNGDSLLNLDKEVPLSGSVAFKLPVGTIYSANITSDPEKKMFLFLLCWWEIPSINRINGSG